MTASILESVTRNFFLEFIPKELGIPADVRDITRAELYACDEVFLCGTGGEVTPITSIDDIAVGKEYPGSTTKKIANYYSEVLAGIVEKYNSRLTPV